MIISIDTEMMNTMAALAQDASIAQEESVVSLIPVVEHYDWNCKERDEINERIVSIKKGNQRLSETLQEFAQSIRRVANQFDEEERAIPSRYQHLDTLLGQVGASETTSVVENTAGEASKQIAEHIATTKYVDSKLENYEIGNLTEPIVFEEFGNTDRFRVMVGPDGRPRTLEEMLKDDVFSKISEEFLEKILESK